MKNISTTLSLATLLTLSSSAVLAGDKYRHYDQGGQHRAKVTWVEPVCNDVRVTTPVRESYKSGEYRRGPQQSHTRTIAGGIIGGIIGNQYRQSDYGYREHCDVRYKDHYEQRVEGYEVGYRYKGREYTTFMDQHPGKFILVEITDRPSHRYY